MQAQNVINRLRSFEKKYNTDSIADRVFLVEFLTELDREGDAQALISVKAEREFRKGVQAATLRALHYTRYQIKNDAPRRG